MQEEIPRVVCSSSMIGWKTGIFIKTGGSGDDYSREKNPAVSDWGRCFRPEGAAVSACWEHAEDIIADPAQTWEE